jgi:hypothetical protein
MKLCDIRKFLVDAHDENGDSIDSLAIGESLIVRTQPEFDDEYKNTPGWDKLPILFQAEVVGGTTFEDPGDGMKIDIVFKIEDKFYKASAYYSSWEGTSWDYNTTYEVEPVQITKTEYHLPKKVKPQSTE